MNKSILIIGGTGCISKAVVEEAVKSNIEVTIINRGHRNDSVPNGVNIIIADKSDTKRIQEALNGKQFTAIADFLCYNKQELRESFGLYNKYTSQYFFISTAQVYDYRKITISTEEAPKVDDRWDYSKNKWSAEEELRKIAKSLSCNYTVIRPSITYGDTRIPYGITPPYGQHGTIIQRILHDKPIIRWNKGVNLCNMMHVEDFARAFVNLIGNPAAYNDEFNICSEKAYSFNEVLDVLSEKLGKKIATYDLTPEQYGKAIPARKGEIIAGRSTDCVSTMSKFKTLFPDFKEEYSLKTGIEKTVDAHCNNNWFDGMSYEFDGECDRIIRKYIGNRTEEINHYNLQYIDYLCDGRPKDKVAYYRYLNYDKPFNKFSRIIRNFISRIYHKILTK